MAKAAAKVKEAEEAKLPAEVFDYAEEAGAGFDQQTNEDVSIPFFSILQALSPEVAKEGGDYKAGMIINKSTGEAADGKQKGIIFIPSITEHLYQEWVPRDKGGGLVNTYPIDHDLVREARAHKRFGAYVMENGNELVETFFVFGIGGFNEELLTPAGIAFSSTNIRPYNNWMTQARSLQGMRPDRSKYIMPLYSHRYVLLTEHVNRKNQSWYVWKPSFFGGSASEARLSSSSWEVAQARQMREAFLAGAIRANMSQVDRDAADAAGSGSGGGKQTDTPF